MRGFALIGAIALAASAPVLAQDNGQLVSVNPQEAEELALSRQIVAQILPSEQRSAMMRQIMDALLSQLRAASDRQGPSSGVNAIVDRKVATIPDRLAPLVDAHLPRIMEGMAQAYVHEFTLAEIREIHAFAMTPVGYRYLSRSTAMMSDPAVAEANQQYLREVIAMQSAFSAELRAEIQAYLAKPRK